MTSYYGVSTGTHQRSFEQYHPRPPTASPSRRLGFATQPHPKNAIAIISGTAKATDYKFGRYIQRVHPSNSPWKIWEKMERGRIQRLPNFLVPPIISGIFGCDIHRVHRNKSPLKILEKRERRRIQGLPKFFEYPLLSQDLVKLRTSNFVRTFIGSIGRKAY